MKKFFRHILAIETSCDDTSVAILDGKGFVCAMNGQNQDDVHAPFGGVIPELACRNHTMRILPLVDDVFKKAGLSWKEIDGIVVTSKPGLIGALLIGVTVAKTLAMLHDLPLLGVNHLEGHLHAPLLRDETYEPASGFDYPFVGLCVSGGHTSLYHVKALGKYQLLGRTVDDAAGEAFDKFGKILGLGYPAGHRVDQAAKSGNPKAFEFPRALMKKGELNFSFSGLKTAGSLKIQSLGAGAKTDHLADLCASYQEAIVDALVEKTHRAVKLTGLNKVVITGGVSANSRLRTVATETLGKHGVTVLVPPLRFCTDNAAMIGLVGLRRLQRGERDTLTLSPEAFMKVAELA